jgi:hypothetical protein
MEAMEAMIVRKVTALKNRIVNEGYEPAQGASQPSQPSVTLPRYDLDIFYFDFFQTLEILGCFNI